MLCDAIRCVLPVTKDMDMGMAVQDRFGSAVINHSQVNRPRNPERQKSYITMPLPVHAFVPVAFTRNRLAAEIEFVDSM